MSPRCRTHCCRFACARSGSDPQMVDEPQRPYALLFCCVVPARPVFALYQLALPDAPSGPQTALPCA